LLKGVDYKQGNFCPSQGTSDSLTKLQKAPQGSAHAMNAAAPVPSDACGFPTAPLKWSEEEDNMLKCLVEKHAIKSWSLIASEHFGGRRTGPQIRAHYMNVLLPQRTRARLPWTCDEDAALLRLHARHGNKWKLIAEQMDTGRAPIDVRNRLRRFAQ